MLLLAQNMTRVKTPAILHMYCISGREYFTFKTYLYTHTLSSELFYFCLKATFNNPLFVYNEYNKYNSHIYKLYIK